MNNTNRFLLAMVSGIGISAAIPLYGAFASATLESKGPITRIEEVYPYHEKIVIKSKSAVPVYLAFFDDNFKKIAPIAGAQGTQQNIIALNENQQVVLTLTKKASRPVVLMSRNAAYLNNALALENQDKRHNFIWNLIKDQNVDVTYFTPVASDMFLVYMNNAGLVPGLLRGVGIVNAKDKDTSFTSPRKMCALRLAYVDTDKKQYMLSAKPADYAQATKANVIKASELPTIEGVVDDVVTFEKVAKIS